MNSRINKFQIITLAVFVVFIIVGVATFALYRGRGNGTELPGVTIWGTFPASTFNSYVTDVNSSLARSLDIKYTEIKPEQFSSDFIAALARGQGPDAILVPADMILTHQDKVIPIPFEALPQRTFLDTYIQEAGVYIVQEGILAVPFTVDPLVMYWNRDMFDTAGIATHPKYWDEFAELNARLTEKDRNGNIRRSAIAMGDFSNVANARELLGTLLLQVGNPVTYRDAEGVVQSAIDKPSAKDPTVAIEFFAQAVDPSGKNYSWNRGMPNSKSAFLSGVLATYFGFSSEIADLRNKNPNIGFDAALVPQWRIGGTKAVYARMYGFSVLKASQRANAAYQVAALLTAPENISRLSESMYMPSVRRDVIARGSSDPYISIFNEAALVSKTWLDANPARSREIFATMINWITTGQKQTFEAIREAGEQYDILLEEAVK